MSRPAAPAPPDENEEGRTAAMAFVWTLVAFKVVTMVLIFVHLRTPTSFLIIISTFWYWIPVIGFLVAGPLLFRYRLIQQRRRREQLRRSEWMIEQGQTTRPAPIIRRENNR